MHKFKVPTKDHVSEGNQVIFDQLTKALGFVPNLYATMAHSENGLVKFLAYQNAKTSLSNKEKEAVNLVVSQVNDCHYCQSAHTVLGKLNGFTDDEIIELRKGNGNNAKIDALVKLAKEVTEHKGKVSAATLQHFYDAGYNEGNVVDVVLQVSDKIAMNYLFALTQIPIDFPLANEI